MATPTADTYSVASGQPVAGGRYRLPLWARGVALNTWTEIANTSAPANCAVDAWGAFCVKPSNSELIIAASGGHSDSSDNGVYSIVLSADAPSWVTRKTSSTPTADVLYYADGTPTSRHLYHYIHYIESIDAVLLAGCRFGYGGSTPTGPGMDLFDLATNAYLARYTYPDSPYGYGVAKDGQGRIWTASGGRFNPADESWTATGATLHRFPVAYDSTRNLLFSMQYGDGQGYDSGLNAKKVDASTGTTSTITINSSAAYTAWLAATPAYAGMDYDAANDRFLFYHGAETGKVYVITPNSGTTWDMSVLTTSGTPAVSISAGINKRFQYVPRLSGFILQPRRDANLWYMRTV